MEIDLEPLVILLSKHRDLDLSGYSKNTLSRRITYFMGLNRINSIEELGQRLVEDDMLFQEFLDKLTINVTEFFRDPPFWDKLTELLKTFFPRRIRSWSAGCSIGCEPYSLAMVFSEHRVLHEPIWATDFDKGALDRARVGVYTQNEIKNVPECYRKYFVEEDGNYHVHPRLKGVVRFEQHNLLQDDFPEGEMDLILCRNVVIYFGHEVHEYLWQRFANALRPGGILFVGASEIIFDPGKYGLSLISHGFYRRR